MSIISINVAVLGNDERYSSDQMLYIISACHISQNHKYVDSPVSRLKIIQISTKTSFGEHLNIVIVIIENLKILSNCVPVPQ